MHKTTAALLATSVLLLPACGGGQPGPAPKEPEAGNAKELIVGKWEVLEGPQKGMYFEFKKDGGVETSKQGRPPLRENPNPADIMNAATSVRYRMVNDTTLMLEMVVPEALAMISEFGRTLSPEGEKLYEKALKEKTMKVIRSTEMKINVTGDQLTMQQAGDELIVKFQRIK